MPEAAPWIRGGMDWTANQFIRMDNWLENLKTKDSDIGEGVTYYAHLGYPKQGVDYSFLPNAKFDVTRLGDMTAFFLYLGQANPTSSKWSPFNYKSSADNIEYSLNEGIKPISSKPALQPKIDSTLMYVDPDRKDTVDYPTIQSRRPNNMNNVTFIPGYEYEYNHNHGH